MRLEKCQWYRVPEYWPQIEEWVSKALTHGCDIYTKEDVREALLSREWQLWLALDGDEVRGVGVTRFEDYRRFRVCWLLLVGGNGFRSWKRFIGEIKADAKRHGCKEIWGNGRDGWKRMAKPFGFEPISTLYRSAL